MPAIAKVRFPSPLPQLDKDFDYLIPAELQGNLRIGQQVRVPFGKGATSKNGIVTAIATESAHAGNLASIEELISDYPVITVEQLELIGAVAKRQAGTIGELLSTAIVKRSVRIEKTFSNVVQEQRLPELLDSELNLFLMANRNVSLTPKLLNSESSVARWAYSFAELCISALHLGESSLVVLPDFADLDTFERALDDYGLSEFGIRHSGEDTGATRYENQHLAIKRVAVNYGLRSTVFAPALNLGLILVWDDADDSHTEQSSPYWTSREVLLQRAALQSCRIVLAAHSPSSETVRLIELGFLHRFVESSQYPLAKVSENFERLDEETFALISHKLKLGQPVLIQIGTLGWAGAVACSKCKEIRKCPECGASIWIDPMGTYRCRSCKASSQLAPCSCGEIKTRPVALGSSAIASQLSTSFPAVRVINSTGLDRVTKINALGVIVVATPGAEPQVVGGYGCVVIADAAKMIGAPRLRALEKAVNKWANAVSLARVDGTVVFVGLSGELAEKARRFDFFGIIRDDYLDRASLGLPPATRLATVTATNIVDFHQLTSSIEGISAGDLMKLLPTDKELTLALDYSYSYGAELATFLQDTTRNISAKSKNKKPGERVFRINMDDSKVI